MPNQLQQTNQWKGMFPQIHWNLFWHATTYILTARPTKFENAVSKNHNNSARGSREKKIKCTGENSHDGFTWKSLGRHTLFQSTEVVSHVILLCQQVSRVGCCTRTHGCGWGRKFIAEGKENSVFRSDHAGLHRAMKLRTSNFWHVKCQAGIDQQSSSLLGQHNLLPVDVNWRL